MTTSGTKIFSENTALALFAARKLRQDFGLACEPKDVAAMWHPVNPAWKQMGIIADEVEAFPHKYRAEWLNGVLALFYTDKFTQWAMDNVPNRRFRPAPSKALIHPKKADEFSYYNMSRLREAGEDCGLIWMGPVEQGEIL